MRCDFLGVAAQGVRIGRGICCVNHRRIRYLLRIGWVGRGWGVQAERIGGGVVGGGLGTLDDEVVATMVPTVLVVCDIIPQMMLTRTGDSVGHNSRGTFRCTEALAGARPSWKDSGG